MTRPRLRTDVQFVPVEGGVCFVTNRGPEVISGKSIYDWVERLAPYLDGRTELDELTSQLGGDRRAYVESIVAILLERGLAKDSSLDRPHELTDEELDRYAAEIAYINSFRDSAAWRFQRYRDRRIVVVGAGPLFVALAHRILQSGVRRLTAAMTAESPTDAARLDDLARVADGAAPILERTSGDDGDLARLAADADLLFHVSDRPMLERALRLDAACARHSAALVQALVVDGEAWVGPVCPPGAAGFRWESAWRRHRRPVPGTDFVDRPADACTVPLGGAVAPLVAGLAGLAAFRHLTGAGTAADAMTRVDLATLHTTSHRFLPHPLARAVTRSDEAGFLAAIGGLRAGSPVSEADFDRRALKLVDERVGVFGEISEGAFTQVPLCVAAVTVAVADADGLADRRRLVAGAGLDSRSARLRAALRGLESYASAAVDRRRLCGRTASSAWAYQLRDGTARQIDAALAFAPAFDATAAPGPGVAAAYSWQEAVENGLLGQCRALTVAAAIAGTVVYPRLELDGVELSDRGTTFRRLLEVAGVEVAVYDLTGPLRVPTLAACVAERTVAYASARHLEQALCNSLEAVLLDFQARSEGQHEYAPAAVEELPEQLRGRSDRRATGSRPTAVDLEDMVAALAEAGLEPLVVPLDHDPAVAAILPYVVNVVVVDA